MIDEKGQQWVEIERLREAQDRPLQIISNILDWITFVLGVAAIVVIVCRAL